MPMKRGKSCGSKTKLKAYQKGGMVKNKNKMKPVYDDPRIVEDTKHTPAMLGDTVTYNPSSGRTYRSALEKQSGQPRKPTQRKPQK